MCTVALGVLARTQTKLAGFVRTADVTLALAVFCSSCLPPTHLPTASSLASS